MKKYNLRYKLSNHIVHTTNNYKVIKTIPEIELTRGTDFFAWCLKRGLRPKRMDYYSDVYTPEEKLEKIRTKELDKLIERLDLQLC